MSKSLTITERERLMPVHPGAIVREDVLAELSMDVEEFARALSLPAETIESIVAERCPVTGEVALRLARYLGTSPEFWMGLQMDYDLESALIAAGEQIAREVKPRTSSPAGDP